MRVSIMIMKERFQRWFVEKYPEHQQSTDRLSAEFKRHMWKAWLAALEGLSASEVEALGYRKRCGWSDKEFCLGTCKAGCKRYRDLHPS